MQSKVIPAGLTLNETLYCKAESMELAMVEIPKILIESLTINGYFRVFYRYLPDFDGNHRKTYEWLEDLRETYGMPRRYDNYQSFARVKSYLLCAGVRVLG